MHQRILLITHHRAFKARSPWRVGGVARALSNAGHSVTVLCTADKQRLSTREFMAGNIRYVETPDLLWGRLRSGWDLWNGWTRWRWLRTQRFDIVHAFETRPSVIHPLLRWLKHNPVPLVIDWCDWWGRGGLIEENRPAWYRFIFGGIETFYEEHYRTKAGATTVIARGLSLRAEKIGVPIQSIFWFPNGCWPEEIAPVDSKKYRTEMKLPCNDFLVGFNALDVTVGFELTLEGFFRAARHASDITLVITGRLSEHHLEQIASNPLGNRVVYLGFVPTENYRKALSCIDLFLLPFIDRPANQGRWPGRINDYLCAGRPIITQPIGEMKTLLQKESIGRLCAADPDDMALSIRELRDRPDLCALYGKRARELAETNLHWKALTPVIEAAYTHAREEFSA